MGSGTPLTALAPGPGARWASTRESGTRTGLRFMVWCFRHLGKGVVGAFLYPIAAYYSVFSGSACRASRAYLQRVERTRRGADAQPPKLRDVYRNFHAFAEAIVDRLSFWTGDYDEFEVVIHGREHVSKHVDSGQGAVFLGAHLGSFDVLRVIARDAGIRVNVLTFFANAQLINEVFRELDPDCNIRVIEIDPTSVRSAFEIKRCTERGEFVALLGDRIAPGGRNRISHATFLGDPAPFPQGPFLVPMLLQLPVVLGLALKTDRRRYDVFFEPFGDGTPVSRQDRSKILQEQIERFAGRLEHYCTFAPDQWFNFFDFWADVDDRR